MPDLGIKPLVGTSSAWGRAPRSLNRDTHMQRLTNRHWVRAASPLDAFQRAALLHHVLDRPESELRVTGLTALQLYGLPLGLPNADLDHLLGHAPPARAGEYRTMMATPHFSWLGVRRKCPDKTVLMTKSYGLGRFPGPWGSMLADPVEALVVAAPHVARWRITACLDALMTRKIRFPGGRLFPLYSRDLLNRRIDRLPPTSRAVRRVRAALDDAAQGAWSPTESLTRLIIIAHGCPPPALNFHVVVDGADRYLDLTWPESKIAVEYNGADHLDRRQYGDEMYRRHRLEDTGWRVRYVVWEDLIDPGRRHLLLEWLSQHLGQRG